LRTFPNPAQSSLYLRFAPGWRADRLELFDQHGRRVLQRRYNGNTVGELDVSTLSPGLYMLRAWSGAEQLTKRIVVK